MKARFEYIDEERLREQYIICKSFRGGHTQRFLVRRACHEYREAFPDDSILNHTHTTEWVSVWRKRLEGLAPATRISILWGLFAWWKWLFDERVIDDNVLDFMPCERLAVEELPILVLRCNLQRHISEHLIGITSISNRSRESYRSWLKRFNVFINRIPNGPAFEGGQLILPLDTLTAWFRYICSKYERITVLQATNVLSGFFDTLANKGVLEDNPLERLRRAYPMGKRLGVAYALAADDYETALASLARSPLFNSCLADQLNAFLALKRAVGCRYTHGTTILRDFDHFLVDDGADGRITSQLLARWQASRPELSPASHRTRWIVMRQFCIYLHRYEPETYIPDPLFGQHPIPQFKPHIIQSEEMRRILDGVTAVAPGSRFALRPHVYTTLFTLLYTTGLRITEALRLRIGDVDFAQRILVIRESKFGKSRIVPFADGLLPVLKEYQHIRRNLLGDPEDDAPFFVTQYGGHYTKNSVSTVWQRLLRSTGLGGGRGQGPRIHDFRHSFATLRLLAWYRDGDDVDAKLPLLSTYLGHSSVWATQRYITILPQIHDAASERFHRYGGSLITCEGGCHELN